MKNAFQGYAFSKGIFCCCIDSSLAYISLCLLYRVIYLNNMVNIYTGIVLLAVL